MDLVSCATRPVIEKHGIDSFLEPFICDLNKLSSEGITVSTNDGLKKFTGALLCFLADNAARNLLGRILLIFFPLLSFMHSNRDFIPRTILFLIVFKSGMVQVMQNIVMV